MPRPVHFEIHSSDPERAQRFYGDVFGWRFQQFGGMPYWLVTTGDGDPLHGTPHSEPGIDGGLVQRQGEGPVAGQSVNAFVVTIDVPDAKAYLDKAVAAGATLAVPLDAVPGVGWLAYVTDPDGNLVGLMQADPSAAPTSPEPQGTQEG